MFASLKEQSMKILFYRYGSICEVDMLDCMRQSGHEVYEITTEITKKDTTYAEAMELVRASLDESPKDCVFSVNFYPSISDLCNIYHIRYISWIVDSPVLELYSHSIANEWNRVFLFDRATYDELYPLNPNCIFHYPLAVNVDGKQKVIQEASQAVKKKYDADVSFVGSLYSEKDPLRDISKMPEYIRGYVDALTEAQLTVFGCYLVDEALSDSFVQTFAKNMPNFYRYPFEGFLTDRMTVSQYYIGNHITSVERNRMMKLISDRFSLDLYTGSDLSQIPKAHARGFANTITEMPLIFHESAINLNPTSRAIRSAIPLRVLDIMACEGLVLSNYQTELCELFTPGEEFAYYDSDENLTDAIEYYLNHEKERREIAHNAFEKVKKEYNYMLRLNRLLLMAFEK